MEILQNTILKLVFRQGTDQDRQSIILTSGEPGFTTDTGRLFVGDGVLSGGLLVGNLFKGFTSDITTTTPAEIGDFVFDTDEQKLFILETGDGTSISDWRHVGSVHTGSTYINIDSGTNEISLNSLSANIFSLDSVQAPIILSSGRIALSSKIPFDRVSTNTITISSGLRAQIGSTDVTNQAINPLSSSNIVISVGQLSAGMISQDLIGQEMTLDSNGRLALSSTIPFQYVSTKAITVSSGLAAYVDGVYVGSAIVNTLSSDLTIVSNDVLARYDGLSGQVLQYSRNLLSVTRLSAGDYLFNYSVPTPSVYVNVDVIGYTEPDFCPRVMSTSSTVCNVHVLSSSLPLDQKRDANMFFRLTY